MLSPVQCVAFRQLLAKGQWFGALPEHHQRALVERSHLRRFQTRQMLLCKGEPSRGFWMLLQGQVLITDVLDDGSHFLFHIGGPGFLFGEIAVLGAALTRVEVTATTPMQALLVPTEALQNLLSEEPTLERAFAQFTLDRMAKVMDYLSHHRVASVEEHLRYRLKEIAAFWREDGYDEPVIELRLSQAEAADLLGISRQTVNRLFARLVSQGLIEVGFRTISILPAMSNPETGDSADGSMARRDH